VSSSLQAAVIVWDVEAAIRNANTPVRDGEMVHKLVLHKGSVRDLAFSPDGSLLASLGGVDDNSVVVWSAESGAAVCGAPAGSHAALTLRWLNGSNDTLVTAGHYTLRRWQLDIEGRRVRLRPCVCVCL
jgi:WD40 repeat protein